MTRIVMYPEWIVDGTGAEPLAGHVVIVNGDRIEAVVPAREVQPHPGDERVVWPDTTLIPGLINNHSHAVLPGNNTPFPDVQLRTDSELKSQAAENLALALKSGVTTLRDCGARGAVVNELRDAQARGAIQRARVIACGWPLTIKGGHVRYFGGEADGADGVREMTQRVLEAGADYVKVMASGGGTPGTVSYLASYSADELKVIAKTAHAAGRKVSAHCSSTIAIDNAVTAGFDFVEHAVFDDVDGVYRFDPAVAEKLARAGVFVSTTLAVAREMLDLPELDMDRSIWQRLQDKGRDVTQRLHAMGVPILAGSDAGWRSTSFARFWKELDELVQCGLTPVAAIYAATGATSHAWGHAHQYGTIRPGLAADLVAVQGDVSRDIRCLANVSAVYQGGVRVR